MAVRRLLALSVSVLLAFSTPVHAWGPQGHEAVGAIADKYINASTRAKVQAILGKGMTLQKAAVWADCAKGVIKNSSGDFEYTGKGKYAECKPYETKAGQAVMIDFVKNNYAQCSPKPGEEVCHKQYHYSDVALQRNGYKQGQIGTSDHDVVAAIRAAVLYLRDGKAPEPFTFASPAVALMVLVHYAGDIHQPLHVIAVYLDDNGKVIDPDSGTYDPATKTEGGNKIEDGSVAIHKQWDSIPVSLDASHVTAQRLAAAKKLVGAAPSDPVEDWSALWATDTITAGKPAFKGLKYSKEDSKHQWQVTEPAGYAKARASLQSRQLNKAGVRLGQLLEKTLP
jgi:hypothetical protein